MTGLEWRYFGLLEYQAEHELVIFERLASEPRRLIDLISMVYVSDRAQPEATTAPSETEQRMASNAWRVLDAWHPYERTSPPDMPSVATLQGYAEELLRLAGERGYRQIALRHLGGALASSPNGTDGVWPHESVRSVIERHAYEKLGAGFVNGRINLRGITSRALAEGGEQERALAAQYREWQAALAIAAPVTSTLLGSLAENCESDAARLDIRHRGWL